MDREAGTLRLGLRVDVVVVDGDPLANVFDTWMVWLTFLRDPTP